MTFVVPTSAGCITAVAARYRRSAMSAGAGLLRILARAWAERAAERERRTTLIAVIRVLPQGTCVVDRDPAGGERFIGPVSLAPVRLHHGPRW